MRKSINGLSILVEEALEMDPFSGYLFAFSNRRRNQIKILYWDRNGFCLWQKRLEKHRFRWPVYPEDMMEIDQRELSRLLEGLDLEKEEQKNRPGSYFWKKESACCRMSCLAERVKNSPNRISSRYSCLMSRQQSRKMIPKGIATPGLLAHIIVSKFEDALPFYRQEKILQRMGVDLPRSTLCNWAVKVADGIEPILSLLQDDIRSGPLINIDETPVQVLKEPGRSNTSKSYMWVYRGGDPDKPVLIYFMVFIFR